MAIEYHLDLGEPMSADAIGEVFAETAAARRMLDEGQHRFDRNGSVLRSHQPAIGIPRRGGDCSDSPLWPS